MANLNDYLALVKKRKAEKQTITLRMPSGIDWVLIPISIQQLITSGRLPTGLYTKIGKDAGKTATPEEMAEAMMKTYETAAAIMLSNLIFPKITEKPSKNSIGIEEIAEKIDAEDFNHYVNWILAGGQAAQDLKSPTDSGK